jgi:hypothetical protein
MAKKATERSELSACSILRFNPPHGGKENDEKELSG